MTYNSLAGFLVVFEAQFLITAVRLKCSVDVETFLIVFIFSNLPLLNVAQFWLSSLVA